MGRYGQHSNASCEVCTVAKSRQSAGFLSSRPNRVSPPPHPKKTVATPFGSKGGDTLACGGEGGGSQCDEGTDALVLQVVSIQQFNPSTSEHLRQKYSCFSGWHIYIEILLDCSMYIQNTVHPPLSHINRFNVSPMITQYTECQAFCAVVRIGSPHPLSRKRVLPPFGSTRKHSLADEGSEGANSDDVIDTLVLYCMCP